MPMTEKELLERDAKRDIGAELLQSVREMKAGKRNRVHQIEISSVIEARQKVGLSQAEFAELLGVSKRTLQDWEQGRREPSGAAKSLLEVARKRPEVLLEIFS
ncbi:MAG: helix-turn-helix domain-containing protein [Bdellovibrionales bacterium]|nr:helix-turn-helix domain-containing protein [Bdellovibrionales bacterium]